MTSGNREKLKAFFKRPFGDDSDAPIPSEIIVVSPYISRDALEDALSPVEDWGEYPQITIICSWRTSDLVSGASDIGVYELCRDKGWKLRVNSDRSTRKIHLKAYLAQYHLAGSIVGRGMIGSANLTNSGLDSNIEYLHPVETAHIDVVTYDKGVEAFPITERGHYNDYFPGREPGSPSLLEAIGSSMAASREVDDEAYESMKEHLEGIGTREREDLPNWNPPWGGREDIRNWFKYSPRNIPGPLVAAIMDAMSPRPGIQELAGFSALEDAIDVRGLRFSQVREIVYDYSARTRYDASWDMRWAGLGPDGTNYVMDNIVLASDGHLDIQRAWTRPDSRSDCLVWRLEPILNDAIRPHLKGFVGKTYRELGLPEEDCNKSQKGFSPGEFSTEFAMSELPQPLASVVSNLTTWSGSIVLLPSGRPKEVRPIGHRYNFDDLPHETPHMPFQGKLWMPSFSVNQAEKGLLRGEVVFLGFGVWEPDRREVSVIREEFNEDARTIHENLEEMKKTKENLFLATEKDRECVFVKVKAGGKVGHLPLGHSKRPMVHYMAKQMLARVSGTILSHDH